MHTIATLTAKAASVLQRRTLLTASGFRVITPKQPEGILQLLRLEPCSALVINSSVPRNERTDILTRVRGEHPHLPIVHIQDKDGDGQPEPLADINVVLEESPALPLIVEKLLRERGQGSKRGSDVAV